jgi:hypothetical protein
MTAQIRLRDTGGTLRTVSRISMRDEGGVLRVIQRVRMRDASGILQTVYESISTGLSDTDLSGTGTTSQITTSTPASVETGGGDPPYNYYWTADYNNDGIYAVTPYSDTTYFSRSGCVVGEVYTAGFYCTTVDGRHFPFRSPLVTISLERTA